METPVQITFRHMETSPALEEVIRKKIEKLDALYDRITGCHVLIEAPHRHHQQGKHFHVRFDIVVPGTEIVVNRDPGLRSSHEDVHVALKEAFEAAKRQLQEYVRKTRGEVKIRSQAQEVVGG
ncbi:MAG: ribosome-associated translation inhibitor RaiA [Deltaproteobacteria bacterium]|nr:MAG: ribosome-associated translation inhibitor RaiA [Deltaproteobacteria bacterium]